MSPVLDVARIRLDNAMLLFDEFVHATVSAPDAATLRGLERRFAEKLQIQPSYWSQIKGRSRQIGERLARQFEQLCRKPHGWMDIPHGARAGDGGSLADAAVLAPRGALGHGAGSPSAGLAQPAASGLPQDEDERFIVGLVLTYYRRHPQRARNRLLDLLGEVLTPPAAGTPSPPLTTAPSGRPFDRGAGVAPTGDDSSLWQRAQAGVAPLKRKRS